MSSRLLTFDAIDNFRDYGDYAVGAGLRLRPGLLLRSAHHARASDADLERVKTLNIGTVVDLRRAGERRDQPSRRPEGFDAQVIAGTVDDGMEAPHITFLKTEDLTPESGRRFMERTYRRLPFDVSHRDVFSRYFRALAETDRPVLIHCAAGKDRTGFLAALTHHLLGVSRDDLIEDFLLTNAAVDLDRRAPSVARQLEKMTGRVASHEAVVAFLGVEPDYLDAAFAEIAKRNGSLDAYLEQVLGVDAALRDRITARLSA
ncbi:protein tyrosine/serine phosphatase [Brevundimonas nasdae]|uniref:tyrosine-protein phosphatase n=1 Tax=Brevundimonas nasdae TaxID=172043 RepID=UPI001913B4AE|nr:tyrosine-protein phosphatase [Brevundimonas nasdae]MBK6025261.1 tyrosine-protein phosphatase [Brevundimonas nasdae]MDQ0451957.1 protein tyrosine/serine phosphatase [Brevundimonas nasdae]